MSEPVSPSWLDGISAAVVDYAGSALQLGNEAAAALGDQLAGALARLQGLPAEASACVEELSGAVCALLGHEDSPTAIAGESGARSGQDGGSAGRARVVPIVHSGGMAQAVPRRLRIEAAAFGAFIRARHPVKPAEHAATLTGIPLDTMAKILSRGTLPNGPHFLRCVIAYGPALLAAVLPEAEERWLIGAQILADQAALDAELARTQAAIADNVERWSFCGIRFGGTA